MGSADVRKIMDIIIEDIKQYEINANRHLGKMITDILAEEAHCAIKDFYTSYHPKYYVRNYNFWKSYKKVHRVKGNTRIAGVELLVDDFPNDYSKQSGNTRFSSYKYANPEDVFWRVYGFGLHGIASLQINSDGEFRAPTMSPSPYKRIIDKRDEIIKNQNKYKELAYAKAEKDKYNILKF